MHRQKMTYALKDGELIDISSVDRGLKCGCVCPSCNQPLIAKKGEKMVQHFAHKSTDECEYGYETSLHLLAKEIISKSKKFTIPSVYVEFHSYKEKEYISQSKEITVDRIELEKSFGGIIPDIVIYCGEKKFFVEIFVTHKIDEEKLNKIKSAGISTIEIDLSKMDREITDNELSEMLLKDSKEKRWIYNAVSEYYQKQFLRYAERIPTVGYDHDVDMGSYLAYCPTTNPTKRKKYYGVYDYDIGYCSQCPFCIAINDAYIEDRKNNEPYTYYVLCTKKSGISSIDDIKNIRNREKNKY